MKSILFSPFILICNIKVCIDTPALLRKSWVILLYPNFCESPLTRGKQGDSLPNPNFSTHYFTNLFPYEGKDRIGYLVILLLKPNPA